VVNTAHLYAEKYAKDLHEEEYEDEAFARDVQQTIRDYVAGFMAAQRIYKTSIKG